MKSWWSKALSIEIFWQVTVYQHERKEEGPLANSMQYCIVLFHTLQQLLHSNHKYNQFNREHIEERKQRHIERHIRDTKLFIKMFNLQPDHLLLIYHINNLLCFCLLTSKQKEWLCMNKCQHGGDVAGCFKRDHNMKPSSCFFSISNKALQK